MILQYFNYAYFLVLLGTFGLFFAIWFPLRNRSLYAKQVAIAVVVAANVSQHLFKFCVWPHMFGQSFGLVETAYNVCAFLILLSPIAHFGKSGILKQFISYVGTVAGLIALFVPYWFIGKNILSWDFARSWTCHTLLFVSSLLPAAWRMVKFRLADGWKMGFVFLLMLTLVFANNAIFMVAFGDSTQETVFRDLFQQNAFWMMGPPSAFEGVGKVLVQLCPSFFRLPDGGFIPILWYAIPMYSGITALIYAANIAYRGLMKFMEARKRRKERAQSGGAKEEQGGKRPEEQTAERLGAPPEAQSKEQGNA